MKKIYSQINVSELGDGDIFAKEIKLNGRVCYEFLARMSDGSIKAKNRTNGNICKMSRETNVIYLRNSLNDVVNQ